MDWSCAPKGPQHRSNRETPKGKRKIVEQRITWRRIAEADGKKQQHATQPEQRLTDRKKWR